MFRNADNEEKKEQKKESAEAAASEPSTSSASVSAAAPVELSDLEKANMYATEIHRFVDPSRAHDQLHGIVQLLTRDSCSETTVNLAYSVLQFLSKSTELKEIVIQELR